MQLAVMPHHQQDVASGVVLPPPHLGPIDPSHQGRREGYHFERDEAFRSNLRQLGESGVLDGALVIDDTGHALGDAGVLAARGFAVTFDLRGITDPPGSNGSWRRLNDQYQTWRHELPAAHPIAPRGWFLGIDVHRRTPLDVSSLADVARGARIVLLDETRYSGQPLPSHEPYTGAAARDQALAGWLHRQLERGATLQVYGIDHH